MKAPLLLAACAAVPVLATAPIAHADTSEIEELKAMVKAMQKTIEQQNARIAALEKQKAAPATEEKASSTGSRKTQQSPGASTASTSRKGTPGAPDATDAGTAGSGPVASGSAAGIGSSASPSNAFPRERSLVPDEDTMSGFQLAAPRANNVPLATDMKGYIPIPGTDTIVKLGGYVRLDSILDFENNGNPNLFVPSSIPVPGQPGWKGGQRTSFQTKGTRLSFELRRPVPFDQTLRIYYENDFFGDSTSNSMNYRVRHLYGQAWNVLIGQTFTAFMDIDAWPDVVDYQGPNGIANRRQPQMRYTQPILEGDTKLNVFASLEQPNANIATNVGATTTSLSSLNRVPDGILGVRWEGTAGHLQAAGLFRDLSLESQTGGTQSTLGWGATLAGALNILEHDKFSAQVTYGQGGGSYVNDLSGQDLDGYFGRDGIEAIPFFAAMAGYTHRWSEHWRSTVSAGYVHVDSPDVLGPYTLSSTIYGSANLMWHPTESFRLGLEYLYGHKDTLGGFDRDAHRLNFVVRYDLVR